MTSQVYQPDAFKTRVDYAARCLRENRTDSRTFDTCFEMHDGDAVVVALIRRAAKSSTLRAAIDKSFTKVVAETGQHPWDTFANRHAHVTDLEGMARKLREDARIAFDKLMANRQTTV